MTALLSLQQWMSPAFPVGSFAYSHGLEGLIEDGTVASAAGLEAWLGDILCFGAGRSDAILLSSVMRGGDADAAAALAKALAASRERWAETMEQGAAFAEAVSAATGAALPPLPYPVAVGLAARRLDLAPEAVVGAYLHAFASTLVSVAVRFVPLGQAEGQRVLTALHAPIAQVAAEAATLELEAISSFVPGADLAAMQHETQDVRMFKT